MPTSKILIPPSKSGKTRCRHARRLVGRQVCRLGGGGVCMRNEPQLWALRQFIAVPHPPFAIATPLSKLQ